MESDLKVLYSTIEKFVQEKEEKGNVPSGLMESLGLGPREVISLVGAGGKTTLMFRLAKELLIKGKKVVTTTTTKILEPISEETPYLIVDSDEEKIKQSIRDHLKHYHHITIAKERLGLKKLKGVSSDFVISLWDSFPIDTMIIEADGAAGRPLKAPREGEPVIPTNTTLVVAILGVDGIGMELNEENVFQPERVSKMTGISIGERITEGAMAILMTHPEGVFKGSPSSSRLVAFLNKVDIPEGIKKAKKVAQKIFEKRHPNIERVVLGQLKNEPAVVEVIFP